jgi:excisionase family DNA binding protein
MSHHTSTGLHWEVRNSIGDEMSDTGTPQLLRVTDICSTLKMSRSAIYREIKAGKIKAFKIGQSLRINAEEVSRYVATLENAEVD